MRTTVNIDDDIFEELMQITAGFRWCLHLLPKMRDY